MIAAWAAHFFYGHFTSPTFLEGAMGNLFATIIGVVVGIPIAIEISRYQQITADRTFQMKEEAAARSRKGKVLALVRKELISNRNQVLECRKPLENGGVRSVLTSPLRVEIWSALSDSGDLKFLENPDLVAAIAQVYHQTRAMVRIESLLLDVYHFPGVRLQGSEVHQKNLIEYLTNDDPRLLDSIALAIKLIDSEICQGCPPVDA